MNTQKDLAKRLLKLYPVKVVKDEFGMDGQLQSDIIEEIVKTSLPATIQNFALNNFNRTKQHIYLFALNKRFNKSTFDKNNFPTKIVKEVKDDNGYHFYCIPHVTFKTTVNNPFEELDLKFIQPLLVSINEKLLIIRATIMEKNIGHYFTSDRKVIDIVKSTTTDYTDVIVKHLSSEYVISTYDINKGIKHLWEKDKIDSRYAKWKKDKSTTTETMDEDYTLKKHYHAIYLDLIKSPLNKMVFKYLLGDGVFCDHFSADPSSGQISIPLYPGNANQITNVINEILANN